MSITVRQFVYILIFLMGFFSCDKNDDEKGGMEDNYDMIIKVEYVKRSETYSDEGSKIYIYFNRGLKDFTALKYSAEGIYYSEDKVLEPDDIYIADSNGLATINFKKHSNVDFSMVVESRYSTRRAYMYFEKYDTSLHEFRFHVSSPD